MSTRIARIATATTLLIGLLATGCSSSGAEQSADPGSPTESSAETSTKEERPVITGNPTTTTTAPPIVSSSTPAPSAPAPTPTPTPTLGEPPVSVPTFITLAPIDFSLFVPRIDTITSIPTLTCLDAALLGFAVVLSWNGANTSQVRLSIDGAVVASGLPASGDHLVPIGCGDTQLVTVTALWADGSAGLSKSYSIKVAQF